jgi:hypothetical protein
LGEIGDARAVELLIEMFGNVSADWNERMSAVWALGKIGDARAVEPLNEVLEYNDYDHINRHYRGAAARALGMIGSARAVEALVKALRDDNRDVRKEAAWALGETGDGCAVGPLIRFFIRTVQPPGLEPNPLPTSRYLHTEFETSYEAVADALRKLPGVGAEFERLGLYDKGEEFYNCYDMLEEAAAMRRAKAEMAAPRTEVHGDYIDDRDTIVKDSVVSKSSIGSSGKSKSEELRDAKALLDDGIIDDAEFQQMKKEILGK